jgi:hypothetical protein
MFRKLFILTFFSLLILILVKDIFYINTRFEYYGGYNDGGLSEWVINYQGGFTRRGIAGEILFQLSSIFSVPANFLWQIITIGSYLYLVFWFVKKTKDKFYLELVISPILIGMPIFTDFVWKKDVFQILLFLLCLSIFKNKLHYLVKLLLINIICIFAILNHESFFFYAIPPLFFISFTFWSKTDGIVKKFIKSFSSFFFILFTFIILFKINVSATAEELIVQAYKIHYSWSNLWLITEGRIPHDLGNAIFFLSSISAKTDRSIIDYFCVAWFLLFILSFYYILQLSYKFKYKNKNFLLKILLSQFIFLIPLFYVAGDWSRWFFYCTASSLAIYLANINYFTLKFKYFEAICHKFLNLEIFAKKPPTWPLFFMGFPYVNHFMRYLDIYVWVTPIGKFFTGFYKFILFFQKIFHL